MLPKNFKPDGTFDLIRVGSDNDGGYLVDRESIKKSNGLISFGINTDWSFEKNFLKINKVPIHGYDPTIDSVFWYKYLLKAGLSRKYFINPKRFIYRFYTFINYIKFWHGKNKIYLEWIGSKANQTNVSQAISRMKKRSKPPYFFSIDIEGSEYELLDKLIDHSSNIEALVIEFHDINNNLKKIESFINQFNLKLIHIHPNNYGGTNKDGDPNVIELSFAKKPNKLSNKFCSPHLLDKVCNKKNQEEIELKFDSRTIKNTP